jgi:hypothetical protein
VSAALPLLLEVDDLLLRGCETLFDFGCGLPAERTFAVGLSEAVKPVVYCGKIVSRLLTEFAKFGAEFLKDADRMIFQLCHGRHPSREFVGYALVFKE